MTRIHMTRDEHEALARTLYRIERNEVGAVFRVINGRVNASMVDKLLRVNRALAAFRVAMENQVIRDTGDKGSWTIYTGGYQRRLDGEDV